MQMELKFCRETLRPYIKDIFKQLHSIPEVSWQEIKTTAFLKERLEELGYKTVIFSDCTGVVGIRGQGPLTVALRADMDAICHSRGMDRRVIHSCGHDAHMAMVLTAACALQDLPLPDNVKVKILFQPAEEKGEGALRLIEKGVADDLDFLFGVHLRPIQELPGGKATPAIQHGAAEPIYGVIKGVSAHGARPHLGINSIEIAVSLVQLLQSMHLDPLIPSSVKMTRLIAGSENGNVIPGYAQFTLDLRAQTNQQMKNLAQKVEQVIANVALTHGAQIEFTRGADSPAAEISREAQEIMSQAVIDTIGRENLVAPLLTPGAEDFHYYTRQRPHIKATMLGLGCDLQPGLHHPEMHFEQQYLLEGAEILTRAVWYACRV